jgi:hypothetical protein
MRVVMRLRVLIYFASCCSLAVLTDFLLCLDSSYLQLVDISYRVSESLCIYSLSTECEHYLLLLPFSPRFCPFYIIFIVTATLPSPVKLSCLYCAAAQMCLLD